MNKITYDCINNPVKYKLCITVEFDKPKNIYNSKGERNEFNKVRILFKKENNDVEFNFWYNDKNRVEFCTVSNDDWVRDYIDGLIWRWR